jgi:hypothetical protein
LSGLFRIVKPVSVSGAKSLGKVALKTGANIVSDIANKREGIKDIEANRVTESVKGLTDKLQQRGKGRKRKLQQRGKHESDNLCRRQNLSTCLHKYKCT